MNLSFNYCNSEINLCSFECEYDCYNLIRSVIAIYSVGAENICTI